MQDQTTDNPVAFEKGMPVFCTNAFGNMVKGTYEKIYKDNIHLVHIEEGPYQGTVFKYAEEIFELPNSTL